jgi:pimeloyl-ACP methyl ester carboxylesterase
MNTRDQILAGLPIVDRRLDLAGASTAVLEGGSGPSVVLLHGPGEFAALWGQAIPDLVTTNRVIAPDLPGHGASELPAARLDVELMNAWLAELIERTCPSPPTIVGHLLGGALAARFAADHPDRLSRLVLVDTFGLSWNRPALRFALPLMTFLVRPNERTQSRFLEQCFVDFDGVKRQIGADRWAAIGTYSLTWAQSTASKPAIRSLMSGFGIRPMPRADLERITVPTSLIWGRHDLQTRLRVAEAASARYGWDLYVIEGARDDPFVEQPAASLRALRSALESPRRGQPLAEGGKR